MKQWWAPAAALKALSRPGRAPVGPRVEKLSQREASRRVTMQRPRGAFRRVQHGRGRTVAFVLAVTLACRLWQQCESGNLWSEISVPPYIPCTLPLCDSLCEEIETVLGQICPRAASTNLKIFGEIPGPNACQRKNLKNWVAGPKISAADPDGCGPCLLQEEKSRCNVNSGDGRGYNAGGPPARVGHTIVRYTTPVRSRYLGATVLIMFGGFDRNENYLNDVWWYCVEKCPTIMLNKRTFNEYEIAEDYQFCPENSCAWEEKGVQQEFIDWLRHKEKRPSTLRRRGIVPSRPAGRSSHTAVIHTTTSQDGEGTTDIMAVFGGQSPNCTDYCSDFWYYDIMENWWILLYGEWWGVVQEWQKMWDYSVYNQATPVKRTDHSAVVSNGHMFLWAGFANGSFSACCGYDRKVCNIESASMSIEPDADCGYRKDMWVTDLSQYIPFESMISRGKHATQSSTLGTGVAVLAVDGNRDGRYSDTWENSVTLTNSDAQAWWQVDLGGPNMISNVTIFNRVDKFGERLQNFYVLFSTIPFLSDQLQDLLADPLVYKVHLMYMEEQSTLYVNKMAQFIRIQLAGTNYLSLAEVEVWGYPPIENWQHTEGMKRWTQVYPEGDYPKGRSGHTMTMYTDVSAVIFGGFVKENPFFLGDFWTALLPSREQGLETPIIWTPLEPKLQKPRNVAPLRRYAHTAEFSPVCSLGYEIEEGVLSGRIVLETLLEQVEPAVYPGVPAKTAWCRGQIIFYGGSTAADRDENHISYPEGYLGDMWIYNLSSNTISEIRYDRVSAHPVRRRDHATAIHKDKLYLFGGASNECTGYTCGDFWVYNVSGPFSCPKDCSGHGVCEWGFCMCDEGFKDDDCSAMNCPQAVCSFSYNDHWQDCLECSGRGECLGNGTCICNTGFKGEACEVVACPGDCSGHGTCKLGGICECDDSFGGPDCFEVFCPNNCTAWGDEYDSGFRGDCVVARQPPCCGQEPDCAPNPMSPTPCIQRDPDFIPVHNTSATCVCADTYIGSDCSDDTALSIIREQQALEGSDGAGCFSVDSTVLVLGHDEKLVSRRLSEVRVGDLVGSLNEQGHLSITPIVFIHDHLERMTTVILHSTDTDGAPVQYELTPAHAVPTALNCASQGSQCSISHTRPAGDIVPGSLILGLSNQRPAVKLVNVTHVTRGNAMVRYVVTANDMLIVDDVLRSALYLSPHTCNAF